MKTACTALSFIFPSKSTRFFFRTHQLVDSSVYTALATPMRMSVDTHLALVQPFKPFVDPFLHVQPFLKLFAIVFYRNARLPLMHVHPVLSSSF